MTNEVPSDTDLPLQEALREVPPGCVQMVTAPGGWVLCGQPYEVAVDNERNLVSDRTVVCRCPRGHAKLIAVCDPGV